MNAILCTEYGLPDKLIFQDVTVPTPQKGEVCIDVVACSINFPDALLIQNMYQFKPTLPFSPGGEVSGIVSAIGEGVTNYQIGDPVVALCGWGGLAEKVVVPENKLIPIPHGMDFQTAASLLYNFGTSLHALQDRANLQPNETLLVLGASGGVGLAAVQLGKWLGARVIAAVSSEEKKKVCLQFGADEAFVYSPENTKENVLAFTAGKGIDVVYDPVGGAYTEPALRCMTWGGRYLVVGFANGTIPSIPANLPLLKGCALMGVFWGRFAQTEPKKNQQNLALLARLFQEGKIKTAIHKQYTLQEAPEAIQALMDRKVIGKAVVVIQDEPEIPVPEKREEQTEIPASKKQFQTLEEVKQAEGTALGTSDWLKITQEMIDSFAKATHDYQWIHTDSERAALSPFGGTIAHGFLTLSVIPMLMEQIYAIQSSKMAINYGTNKVRFLSPVKAGSEVRLTAHFKAVSPFGVNGIKMTTEAIIEIKGQTKPACLAELLSIVYE